MAYQRFALAKSNMPTATVATIATLRGESAPNVATVASAPGNSSTLPDPERAAILEVDGGVPAVFAEAFASLMATCPDGVPEGQWWQAIDDAGRFLDAWGDRAADLGWTGPDLFERVARGAHGLVWELGGRNVIALTETTAALGPDDRTERSWFAKPTGGVR
mgnify:CR=1 FL=1